MLKIIALTLVLFSTTSWALDLKGFQFTDAYRYSTLEDSYTEKFNGKNVFLGSYAYVRSPFYYTDSSVKSFKKDIINYNNVLSLGYSRYLTDKLAMGLDVVGINNKVYDKQFTSFGDINLRAKYLLTERSREWGLSVNPFITLPTGKKTNFTTARSPGLGLRSVLEKHFSQWHWLASAGYEHNPKKNYLIVDQRNLLLTQLGVSYDLTSTWNANAEIIRNFTLQADNRQDEGDYFLTMKNKTTSNISLFGGAGIAGAEKVERNNYNLFAGFKWQEDAEKERPTQVQEPVKPAQTKVAPTKPQRRAQENQYGKLIAIDNIYFSNNSFVITKPELQKLMRVVHAHAILGSKFSKVIIEGYASTLGDTAKNEVLALRRTEQVMNILKSKGIEAEKMATVSYGDQTQQDPEEWKNRKVQFRVYQSH